ncbi:MAG: 50S ribosomal protein L1 [Candidatus Omnitrophica bacterium]|nr:50S ribosomal protein L1 [Candidatus Omnitrophota bacterium]
MSKRTEVFAQGIEKGKRYSIQEAVALLKKVPAPKFDETVELAIALDIDPKQSDQAVRGTVILPHGTGRSVKILVIAKGDAEREAKEAGADHVGAEELLAKIQGGWTDFDVMVAVPDLMKEVGKLGKVLGPKGLMPSPKAGTVTADVGRAVQELKKGKVEFKVDKQGDIHLGVGKRSFSEEALAANLRAILEAIWRARPASVKGRFVSGISVSSTMGPGIRLNPQEGKQE